MENEYKIWKGPYYIGTLKFKTIKECENYVRDKIGTEPRIIKRCDEQFQFFRHLLRNHSEYKTKKGTGIEQFEFIKNPLNKKAMHGTIKRNDGTTTDFSWLHCCRNNNTKLTDNSLNNAMRQAISKDTIQFKKQQASLLCQLCNVKELPYSEYHTDHKYPSFIEIEQEFLQAFGHTGLKIPNEFNTCHTTKISIFKEEDKEFENKYKL
jgi:hypothetical protein